MLRSSSVSTGSGPDFSSPITCQFISLSLSLSKLCIEETHLSVSEMIDYEVKRECKNLGKRDRKEEEREREKKGPVLVLIHCST